LSIVNPSTLLLIERMNLDIFIFLISIFIIFNRFYIINWISIFFLSLTKFYPAILGISIILENKNRKLLTLIFIILGSIPFITYIKFLNGNKKIFISDSQIRSFIKITLILLLMREHGLR